MTWRRERNQSPWREFEFMMHKLRNIVEVPLTLRHVLRRWPEICKGLAEAPRKRRPRQIEGFTERR